MEENVFMTGGKVLTLEDICSMMRAAEAISEKSFR